MERILKKNFYKKSSENIVDIIGSIQLNDSNEKSTDKQSYIDFVSKIKMNISSNNLLKILAAQHIVEHKPTNFDLLQCFENLKKSFPNTLVFLFYHENSIWIGATPELVGKWKDDSFETLALAGTAISSEKLTSKEADEQGIVLNQIESILSFYSSQKIETKKTTLDYGSLVHYQNTLSIPLTNYEKFLEITHQIHPSAALVGYPKEQAIEFVLNNEPIDRKFYTGLVTLKTDENQIMSYGLIRLVQITNNQLIWYAGAGITSESEPEKEYNETLNKIETVKNAMF